MNDEDYALEVGFSKELADIVLGLYNQDDRPATKADIANIAASMLLLFDVVHANSLLGITDQKDPDHEKLRNAVLMLQKPFSDQLLATLDGLKKD